VVAAELAELLDLLGRGAGGLMPATAGVIRDGGVAAAGEASEQPPDGPHGEGELGGDVLRGGAVTPALKKVAGGGGRGGHAKY
jgi:hypothetical protein